MLLAACPCLLGSSTLRAQTFEGVTDVVEVEIPVHIVDRDGEPVRGLTAEDFEILDNGRPQEITGFRVIDLDLIEPGDTRVEVESAVPAAGRRHVLLLFDLSFSAPPALLRARDAARAFVLENLHPTDLVAVATHSIEQGARLLVTFTPDRAQVARAIDTLGAPKLLQLARRDPLQFVIEDPLMTRLEASSDLGSENPGVTALQQEVIEHLRVIGKEIAKTEKSFQRGRVSSWSRSMGELARFLDSVRGRKHVVYFSEGFDGRLLLGRQPSADDREAQEDLNNITTGQLHLVDMDNIYGNTGLQVDMELMLGEFRRADVVIEAVDIGGLRADSAGAERVRSVGQDALFYLANDTGGNLYQDANDFGVQLERIMERSAVTYLVSFRPQDIEHDGSYHRLKVRVDTAGRVVARDGYYAPRPWEEMHPFEKGLIASGAIAAAEETNAIALDVLAAPFRAGALGAYVPVIIEIEGASLLAGQEGHELPVELFTYATNDEGEMKDFFTQMVTLDLSSTRQAFASSGLKYYGHLELEPDQYLLRVLVRNAQTGRSGLATVSLHVPAYDTPEPVLLPPFFVENARRWFMVRETTSGNQPSVVYPFTINGEPYVPAAKPSLTERDEAQLCLVAYNLGEGGTVDVDGTVVAEDGSTVAAFDLTGLERTVTGIDGLDKFLATFRTDGLSEGNYTLRVAMTDPATGVRHTNSISFSVY